MNPSPELFCFTVDDQQYAFPLLSVDRIMQAVAVHAVPNAPPLIYGLLDYFGTLIPVINFRHRLNLQAYPIKASDYFVVVETSVRKLALVIEEVGEVIRPSATDLFPAPRVNEDDNFAGIVRREGGIIVIYDLEALLSSQEESLIRELLDPAEKNEAAL